VCEQDKKESLLVIGAGAEQTSLIKAAKRLGFFVVGVDGNPNSEGFLYCDEKRNINITDTEACLQLALKYKVAGVTTATEKGLETAGYIRDTCRFYGNSLKTIKNIKNKFTQASILEKNKIPVPKTRKIGHESDLKDVPFPAIIKPPDNAGSRGVFLVESSDELKTKLDDVFRHTECGYGILQEYIEGKELGAEVVVQNSQVKGIYISEKISSDLPFFVVMGHKIPAVLPQETIQKIRDTVTGIIKIFSIKDSMVNFDLKLADDTPYVLEFGPRLGGNCLPYLVQLTGGGDNYENAIKLAIGDDVKCFPGRQFSSIRYFNADRRGILKNICFDEKKIGGLVDRIEILKKEGDVVSPTQKIGDRMGFFIVSSESEDDLYRKISEVNEIIKFIIE